MPDADRLVEVRAAREGSGYLIADRLVLTALHVFRLETGERVCPEVRVRVQGRIAYGSEPSSAEQSATLLWPTGDPGEDLDFALLLLDESADRPIKAEPVSWAALPLEPGELPVQALGYPNVSIDRARETRDTFGVQGLTNLGESIRGRKAGRGTFGVYIPPHYQPPRGAHDPWAAMSGAAVFDKAGTLVGVIRLWDDERRLLRALPVDRLFEREDVAEVVRRADCILPQRISSVGRAGGETYSWPEAWDFGLYTQDKRASFEGREWLFKKIDEWVATGASEPFLLILAQYGVGKSALMTEYLRVHQGREVLAWYFCRHDTQETLRPATFVRTIAAQLADYLPPYRQAIEGSPGLRKLLDEADSDPASAFEATVLSPLSKVPAPTGVRLLLVDALDEALDLDAGEVRRRLTIVDLMARKARLFPSWLRVLATSRPNPEVLTTLEGVRKIDAESKENEADVQRYVLGQASGPPILERLQEISLVPKTFALMLARKSGGKFLFVYYALNGLVSGRLSIKELIALPEGMDAFYKKEFERQFGSDSEGYSEARKLLGVMCVALEPLSRPVLAEILGSNEDRVRDIQARLPDFLQLRGGQLNFSHPSLSQWLIGESADGLPAAGRFAVSKHEARAQIYNWAHSLLARGQAHKSPYLLRHLAAHLKDDEERQKVYSELLTRFEWSQAQRDLRGWAGVFEDWKHLAPFWYGIYRDAFERHFGSGLESYRGARELLGVMCVALEPLSLPVLAEILGSNEDRVRDIQARLPDFLQLRGGQLNFCHSSLSEWLTNETDNAAGRFAVSKHEARAQIYNWAHSLLARGQAHKSPYLLRHLAAHLKDNEERSEIYSELLLTRFEWSQAQLDLRGSRGLLADVEHLSGHSEATIMLRSLIRQAEPALRESTAQWPAQVLGRLGTGSNNIGLESLATAAQCWALDHGNAHAALVPLRRSLPWRSELLRQLEGTVPIVVLPGGLIAYARGNEVCCCDPARNDEPKVLEGHTGRVYKLAVLPDGRVVSGSQDGSVRVWCLQTGNAQLLEGHTPVSALAVLADGRVVSGSFDGNVRVWSLDGGTAQVLEGHTPVSALAVLADGRVVSGSFDGNVRVWSLDGGTAQVLEGHAKLVSALAVLPDGRVISGSQDGSVRVWSLQTGTAQELEGHAAAVNALAVLPDGRVVSGSGDFLGSSDDSMKVWSLETGTAQVLKDYNTGRVRALTVLPDGRVVSGSEDTRVRVWSLETGDAQVLEGHTDSVAALAVFPDGRLVSGSDDTSVRVWTVESGAAQLLEGHTGPVGALAVLDDGRLVSGSDDGSVRVWSVETGDAQVREAHTDEATALAVLPDGRVVSGSLDKSVRVWSLETGGAQVLEGHTGTVTALAVLGDGRVVSGSRDTTVRVWSLDGASAQVLKGHTDWVTALTVLADGRLVSGSWDNTVRVWRLETGEAQVLGGHSEPVSALAVLADGRVVSGSYDKSVRVWNLETVAAQVLKGHTGGVTALAVLPDGRVVSGDRDNSVRLWSLETGAAQVLEGHTRPVSALAVLADGCLVSGSEDRSVRVWNRSFDIEHSFIADSPVTGLCFNPAGVIAAGCEDGTVHLLRLPPERSTERSARSSSHRDA